MCLSPLKVGLKMKRYLRVKVAGLMALLGASLAVLAVTAAPALAMPMVKVHYHLAAATSGAALYTALGVGVLIIIGAVIASVISTRRAVLVAAPGSLDDTGQVVHLPYPEDESRGSKAA
jgi:hypothetical protein